VISWIRSWPGILRTEGRCPIY